MSTEFGDNRFVDWNLSQKIERSLEIEKEVIAAARQTEAKEPVSLRCSGCGQSFGLDARKCHLCGSMKFDKVFDEVTPSPAKPASTEEARPTADQWWSKHQDDFVERIAGTGLATHSLYDVPAALAAYASHVTQGLQEENAKLKDHNADLAMLASRWMSAHDALAAGKPYKLPSPADLPVAEAENAKLREECAQIAESFSAMAYTQRIAAAIRAGKRHDPANEPD